jgi:hypothetical protein
MGNELNLGLSPAAARWYGGGVQVALNDTVVEAPGKKKKESGAGSEAKKIPSYVMPFFPTRISGEIGGNIGGYDSGGEDRWTGAVNREAGGLTSYYLAIKFGGGGKLFGNTPNTLTSLDWELGFKWTDMMEYRKMFETSYNVALINKYFIGREDIVYNGFNFFGNPIGGDSGVSVPERWLSRTNPDEANKLTNRGTAGVPFKLFGGRFLPYLAYEWTIADINYFPDSSPHFWGKLLLGGGITGDINGYRFMGEYMDGVEGEQSIFEPVEEAGSTFSNVGAAIKNSIFRAMTQYRFDLRTPSYWNDPSDLWLIRGMSFNANGYYRKYGEGNTEFIQYGIAGGFTRGPVGFQVDYEWNPLMWTDNNHRITFELPISFDITKEIMRSENSRTSTRAKFVPYVSMTRSRGETEMENDMIIGLKLVLQFGRTGRGATNPGGFGGGEAMLPPGPAPK